MQNLNVRNYWSSVFLSPLFNGSGRTLQAGTSFLSLRYWFSRRSAAYWPAVLSLSALGLLLSIFFFTPHPDVSNHPIKYITRMSDWIYLLSLAGIILEHGWRKSFVIFALMIVCFRFQVFGVIFAYLIIVSIHAPARGAT